MTRQSASCGAAAGWPWRPYPAIAKTSGPSANWNKPACRGKGRMPSPRQWTLVATIAGSSLTFVDATVVNVALPALQTELHATITDVQWVIEAYALFLGGLILVGGSMGDQFGRKRTFLAGVMLFTIASIACGFAGSTRALI